MCVTQHIIGRTEYMTQILKANQVSTGGQVKLNLNTKAASPTQNTIANSSDAPAMPTVRIVETTDLYTVLEVKCQCGQINLVRCDF